MSPRRRDLYVRFVDAALVSEIFKRMADDLDRGVPIDASRRRILAELREIKFGSDAELNGGVYVELRNLSNNISKIDAALASSVLRKLAEQYNTVAESLNRELDLPENH